MSSRTLNFLMILAGGIIALYAETGDDQNVYILIGGIFLLMVGFGFLSLPEKSTPRFTTISRKIILTFSLPKP